MRAATQDCNPRLGTGFPYPNHFGLLLSFYVNLSEAGYNRIRFELFYDRIPDGVTVRIDDAVINDPSELEPGEHSVSDIEIVDSALTIYGNPANRTSVNGEMACFPYRIPDAINTNHSLIIEIEQGRVQVSSIHGIQTFTSPDLFILDTQSKLRTPGHSDLYLLFFPTHPETDEPNGLSKVLITYFPAE